jgi:hypothetical protein
MIFLMIAYHRVEQYHQDPEKLVLYQAAWVVISFFASFLFLTGVLVDLDEEHWRDEAHSVYHTNHSSITKKNKLSPIF